jgi:type IV pilus assembly protein PilW
MVHKLNNKRGFTLIELLVAMGLSAVVMASIGYVYLTQQNSYLVQEQLAATQQNLRAAMYIMEREIRMAGYDPTEKSDAGIVTFGPNTIAFKSDLNADRDTSDTDEEVTYSLYTSDGIQKLGRKSPSTAASQPVAENIDVLNFVYLNENGGIATTTSQIRSVQVTVVARTDRPDPRYRDTIVYKNIWGDTILGAQNDQFRRRMLGTTIKCRNLWL